MLKEYIENLQNKPIQDLFNTQSMLVTALQTISETIKARTTSLNSDIDKSENSQEFSLLAFNEDKKKINDKKILNQKPKYNYLQNEEKKEYLSNTEICNISSTNCGDQRFQDKENKSLVANNMMKSENKLLEQKLKMYDEIRERFKQTSEKTDEISKNLFSKVFIIR